MRIVAGRRKYYHITNAGNEECALLKQQWAVVQRALQVLAERYTRLMVDEKGIAKGGRVMFELESQIRKMENSSVFSRNQLVMQNNEELESHLRDSIDELTERGINLEEASCSLYAAWAM